MENKTSRNPSPFRVFSMQRIAYTMIIIFLSAWFIIIAKPVLIPITFAIFFALMIKPVCDFFDKYIPNDFLSILLSFIVVLIPIISLVLLFSFQVASVFEDLNAVGDKLKKGVNEISTWIYAKARSTGFIDSESVSKSLGGIVDIAINFIKSGLNTAPNFLINIFITLIYTFFLLYYRMGIKNFMMVQVNKDQQEEAKKTFSKIQKVAQKYLFGLGFVILIMGTLNTIGLYLIGIQYPALWGFLAAFLTIIPYIGTMIGGMLPFLFAAATTDTLWQPFAVVGYYALIQFIEGNLISPKIIGNSVSVNPMAAILSLIISGYMWGVAGVVLALPIIAIIRIVFSEIDWLKPFALLISNDLYDKEDKFKTAFNQSRFRFSSIFRTNKSSPTSRKE